MLCSCLHASFSILVYKSWNLKKIFLNHRSYPKNRWTDILYLFEFFMLNANKVMKF